MLFVTSFDDQLYGTSARELIRTFASCQTTGELLCCYEGSKPEEINGNNILGFNITHDPFLIRWDGKYRGKCHGETHYWRRRAWQWYRKCVSLRLASRYLDPRWLIWLDCDCEFKLEITEQFLTNLAPHDGTGIFHLLGGRAWTETGVLIFDRKNMATRRFLDAFFECYESGEFLKLKRWDDCWIFDEVRNKFYNELFCDLAPKDSGLDVVEVSRISEFIAHKKGSHLRKGVRA